MLSLDKLLSAHISFNYYAARPQIYLKKRNPDQRHLIRVCYVSIILSLLENLSTESYKEEKIAL